MSDRVNFRMLVDRVKALEDRVGALDGDESHSQPSDAEMMDLFASMRAREKRDEAKLEAKVLERFEQAVERTEPVGPFTVRHVGFGRYFCLAGNGTKVNERGLPKADAQKIADDMNGLTHEMATT